MSNWQIPMEERPLVDVAVSNRSGGVRGIVFDRKSGAVYAYLMKPLYRGEPMTLSNTASLARELGFRLSIDEPNTPRVDEDAQS